MLNNWFAIIQDYLLPPTCLLCGSPGRTSMDLCAHCRDLLARNDHCCCRCAVPFEHAWLQPLLCGDCQRQPASFDETYAPFLYQGAIRYLIAGLKFHSQFKNARLLGMLLAQHLPSASERPECLIPVPLHGRRYRERGFNQAAEIARVVGRELAIPVSPDSCIRRRNTPHQVLLSAKRRRQNVKQAFAVRRLPKARHVAIVDDVMTTGATVAELARVLKKAGVARVEVWVCARA